MPPNFFLSYTLVGANAVAKRENTAPVVRMMRIFIYQFGISPRIYACLSTAQANVKAMVKDIKQILMSKKMIDSQPHKAGIIDQMYQYGDRSSLIVSPQ